MFIIFYRNPSRKCVRNIFPYMLTIRGKNPSKSEGLNQGSEVEMGVFLALHGISDLRYHTSGTMQ